MCLIFLKSTQFFITRTYFSFWRHFWQACTLCVCVLSQNCLQFSWGEETKDVKSSPFSLLWWCDEFTLRGWFQITVNNFMIYCDFSPFDIKSVSFLLLEMYLIQKASLWLWLLSARSASSALRNDFSSSSSSSALLF